VIGFLTWIKRAPAIRTTVPPNKIKEDAVNEFAKTFETLQQPWTPEEFEARIRAVGPERYHDKHEFHKMLHGG
jgi:hypothetical protein